MAKNTALRPSWRTIARASAAALVLPLTWQLCACSDANPRSLSGDPSDARAMRGELLTYVATYENGTSERQFFLRRDDGGQYRLLFDGAPAWVPSSRMAVWGSETTEGIHVAHYETIDPNPPPFETFAVAPATPKSISFAFVLVDVGGGVSLTTAQAQQVMFGTNPTDKSFKQFYEEASFGALAVTGDVYGPLTYTMLGNCATNGGGSGDSGASGGPDALATALRPQIPKTYDHYVYYFGTKVASCRFTGLALEGSVTRPARNTWINGSTGCVVLTQEPGHNLGLRHASTLACPNASFANDPSTCVDNEYGNPYTPMGHGCHNLNVYEKWYEGWLDGCNGVKVTSSGTFTLLPLEIGPCGGIQALEIPMPVATRSIQDPQKLATVPLKNYYVELREPLGMFDSNLSPTVLVYAADDIHPPTAHSIWSYLLDMDPSTPAFDGLAQGKTFTDPAGGVSITLQSLDMTKATIKVDIQGGAGTAPTCIDGTTLRAPGPASCGVGGGSDAGPTSSSGSATDAATGLGGGSGHSGSSSSGSGGGPASSGAASGGANGGAGSVAANGTAGSQSGVATSGTAAVSNRAVNSNEASAGAGCGCRVSADSNGTRRLSALVGLAMLRLGRRRRRRTPATRRSSPAAH